MPFIGDLPFLGNLFRSKTETGLKREVIIVITPSVLPDDTPVHAGMPKDEDLLTGLVTGFFAMPTEFALRIPLIYVI